MDVAPTGFVAWMPGGLVPGFGVALRAISGVSAVTVARTGTLHIVASHHADGDVVDGPSDGFVIPVEAVIVDSGTYGAFVEPWIATAFGSLGGNKLALGETSAQIRRLAVGDSITFEGGIALEVGAIIPDAAIGGTEIAVTDTSAFLEDNSVLRYAIVAFDGDAAQLEDALSARLPNDGILRVRGRRSDRADAARAVQPPVVVKQRFGEFAYQPPDSGTRFEVDPAWRDAHIVTVDIPLLGVTKCHREFAAALTTVMQSLVDDGLEDVIDASTFRGCWNPRYIAGTTRLSRHAFGVAADINFGNSLDGGPGSPVHPELLSRMADAGITSGHAWSAPDPGHFEWFSDAPLSERG